QKETHWGSRNGVRPPCRRRRPSRADRERGLRPTVPRPKPHAAAPNAALRAQNRSISARPTASPRTALPTMKRLLPRLPSTLPAGTLSLLAGLTLAAVFLAYAPSRSAVSRNHRHAQAEPSADAATPDSI